MADHIDANEMARRHGISPKAFLIALRRARLSWHIPGKRWQVKVGGGAHRDMMLVLSRVKARDGGH